MKQTPKQSGFSAVILPLVLVIISIIGGIGWYVWKSQRNTKQSANATQPTSSNQAKKDDNSNEQTQKTAQKYLEIKELGIKLKLTDGIKNIYYAPRTDTTEPELQYVDIFDKDIDSFKNVEGKICKDTNFPLAVLGRISVDDYNKKIAEGYSTYGPTFQFPDSFKFDSKYKYVGTGWHQSYPECAFLTGDYDNENIDDVVLKIYNQKKEDIIKAYKSAESL